MTTSSPTTDPPVRAGSQSETLLTWYRDHPGMHRCMDISPDIQITTHRIAMMSRRLHDRGLIERTTVPVFGRAQPVTYYGITTATTAEEA